MAPSAPNPHRVVTMAAPRNVLRDKGSVAVALLLWGSGAVFGAYRSHPCLLDKTSSMNHEENDLVPRNGPSGKMKVMADEVTCKIESGLRFGKEGKIGERDKATNA
ncbi:hypothetical protein SCA6_017117 [Theobroma cacao]